MYELAGAILGIVVTLLVFMRLYTQHSWAPDAAAI
jgi:hypothetical protein